MIVLLAAALAAPSTEEAHALLSARHDPGCDVLFDGDDADVVDVLIPLADGPTSPPWVGTRAAACVASRAADLDVARTAALRWVSDPALPGLALVVLDHLDALPEDVAEPIARRAVQTAHADPRFARFTTPRLRRSAHPTVVALVP